MILKLKQSDIVATFRRNIAVVQDHPRKGKGKQVRERCF